MTELAFCMRSIGGQDTANYVLPYRGNFLQGRVLFVPVPSLPPVTARESFSNTHRSDQARQVFQQTPNANECAKLHELGSWLFNAAARGNWPSIAAIYGEAKKVRQKRDDSERAIPRVFMVQKLGAEKWQIAFYQGYGNEQPIPHHEAVTGFHSHFVSNSLQQAADWLCDSVDYRNIDLSRFNESSDLKSFPSTRMRRGLLRKTATRLRRENWTPAMPIAPRHAQGTLKREWTHA